MPLAAPFRAWGSPILPLPSTPPPEAPSAGLCGAENQVNGILAASGKGGWTAPLWNPSWSALCVRPCLTQPFKSPGWVSALHTFLREPRVSISHQELPQGFDFRAHWGTFCFPKSSTILFLRLGGQLSQQFLVSVPAQYRGRLRLWIREALDSCPALSDLRQNNLHL